MTTPSTRWFLGSLLLAALLSSASCAPPVVSAGISVAEAGDAAFFEGALQAAVKHDLATTFAATNKALAELAYEPSVSNLQAHRGEVTARESNDGRLVVVTLKESSLKVTLIQVRVGLFGDQQISRLVMTEIVDSLNPDARTGSPLHTK